MLKKIIIALFFAVCLNASLSAMETSKKVVKYSARKVVNLAKSYQHIVRSMLILRLTIITLLVCFGSYDCNRIAEIARLMFSEYNSGWLLCDVFISIFIPGFIWECAYDSLRDENIKRFKFLVSIFGQHIGGFEENVCERLINKAIQHNKTKIVEYLIHRWDFYIESINGDSKYKVFENGNFEVIELLLKAGLDVNEAFFRAIQHVDKHPEIIDLVIAAGADLGKKNESGKSFFDYMEDSCYFKYVYEEHPYLQYVLEQYKKEIHGIVYEHVIPREVAGMVTDYCYE